MWLFRQCLPMYAIFVISPVSLTLFWPSYCGGGQKFPSCTQAHRHLGPRWDLWPPRFTQALYKLPLAESQACQLCTSLRVRKTLLQGAVSNCHLRVSPFPLWGEVLALHLYQHPLLCNPAIWPNSPCYILSTLSFITVYAF